jgi:hypothetical protein
MFQVLKQVPIPAPDSRRDLRAKMRNVLGYLGFHLGTMIEVTGACDGRHCELLRCKARSAPGWDSQQRYSARWLSCSKSSPWRLPQKRNRQPDRFFRLAA